MTDGLDTYHYAILRVAKVQVGLTDDDYRAILLRFSGQDSTKRLDRKSFGKIMAHFELLGFKSTSAKKDAGRRPGMASEAQLRKIAALWSQFTDGTGDETSLRHWMEKHRHGHGPKWLEKTGAQKVIAALTNMVERRTRRQG
ncbi:regulatory protein GemA [Rhizobium sp. FY34]|uniref:regulatory protein GemA n=1 Tax=Rhizobium sp. FY34 TaxID=2562309 RepID=UPI001484F0D5|nr:regulatory protein GemA [Rhizobium sp. FY34]